MQAIARPHPEILQSLRSFQNDIFQFVVRMEIGMIDCEQSNDVAIRKI